MTDAEVEAALTEVPGIGPWTARGFLLVGLDRPDVTLSGDLALRRAVQRAYGLNRPPTDEEMAQISNRWRPTWWRSCRYSSGRRFGSGRTWR
jgi:DNA-3-methyladenine glycosylase II